MIVILDDALKKADLETLKERFAGKPTEFIWEDYRRDTWQEYPTTIFSPLIDLCKKHFDISQMVGYEYWSRNSNIANIGWHIDLDEGAMKLENRMVLPIVSIVYYPLIEDLVGGEFVIKTPESITIAPKSNRLILFGPGMIHKVEPYEGNRLSVLVNLFPNKIMENPNAKKIYI